MNLICSNCNDKLLSENINIATNLGKCVTCNSILKLDELAESPLEMEVTFTPPIGSNIEVSSIEEGVLLITLPKSGIKATHIPTLAFATFWLFAISLFTFFSFSISWFPVLFSIPFWAVGIFMILGVVKGSQVSQKITLSKETIKLESFHIYKSNSFQCNISDIQEVTFTNNQSKSLINHFSQGQGNSSSELGAPTILSYADNKTFFELTSEENQVWIVTLLNSILKKD